LKGKIQRELPWIYWAWCYAHRLELACKDSLSSELFRDVIDMLLQLYYLYSRSPKKCRELTDIVENLKEVFEFPPGGNLPVRSHGSRWISHKRNALQRLVDRYGAYLNHLLAIIEDSSVTSEDKARLKGYIKKWKNPRMLIGAALYVDILKPPSILSLSLQDNDLDSVSGIKSILKTRKSLKLMLEKKPLQWPTTQLVIARIKEEGGESVYQGTVLNKYAVSVVEQCAKHALKDLKSLENEMKNRLEWSDIELLRSILTFMDTQSWAVSEGSEDEIAEISAAVEHIVTHFREPLVAVRANLASIQDELEEVVDYSRKYLNISVDSHQSIWYKLHSVRDSSKWPNILLVVELLFSLPFANSKVERMFSTLKIIKTDRRTQLNTDLLEIQIEGPPLQTFVADAAVKLWWDDCCTTRRVNQEPRKTYRPRSSSSSGGSSSEVPTSSSTCSSVNDFNDWFDL